MGSWRSWWWRPRRRWSLARWWSKSKRLAAFVQTFVPITLDESAIVETNFAAIDAAEYITPFDTPDDAPVNWYATDDKAINWYATDDATIDWYATDDTSVNWHATVSRPSRRLPKS
jgi:hypothetical protein